MTTESFKSLSYYEVNNSVSQIDNTVQSIIDSYTNECSGSASEVMCSNSNGTFDYYGKAPLLMAKAIYDTVKSSGYNIDLAYVNQARHDLSSGQWTYGDIYQAFPFENQIYIFDIPYSEYINEVSRFNWICKDENTPLSLDRNGTLKIACIDYLAFHTNKDRNYDYFPSMANRDISSLSHLENNYRTILCNWLKANEYNLNTKTLDSKVFDESNNMFNKYDVVWA